jgi:hypothetical protein
MDAEDQLDDNELLMHLARALPARDPVPPQVVAAARGSFTWRTVDAEIAELIDDSLLSSVGGVRGEPPTRMLTFEAPGMTVVLEVGEGRRDRRLVGQVLEPQVVDVELLYGAGPVPATSTARSDALGRFTLDAVPPGLARLTCRSSQQPGTRVVTNWVEL